MKLGLIVKYAQEIIGNKTFLHFSNDIISDLKVELDFSNSNF
jgi:hypothetical protein